MWRLFVVLSFVFGVLTKAPQARAQSSYDEPSSRDIVVAYNRGPRVAIAPAVLMLSGGGDIGFSLVGDFRYGIETGPVIWAPGVRLSGFFPPGAFALTALGTGRLTLPLGPVGPFVMAGVGPGYVSEPQRAGLAYQGGGGLMIHFGRYFALGAEVAYLGITGTDFRALFFGPSFFIGF